MKKITILFFIQGLFVYNSLLSANSPTDAISQYSHGLDSIITCNSNGDIVKKVNNYVFDENNRLISCIEEKAEEMTKYKYNYDNCGNQVSYVVSKFDKNAKNWAIAFEEKAVYKGECSNSLVMFYFREGYPDTAPDTLINESITYQYTNGKITRTEKKDDTNASVVQEVSYAYDSGGRTTSIAYKNVENNILKPTSKTEYTYFPVAENISHFATETIFRYDNETPVKCMKTTYDPSAFLSDSLITATIEYYNEKGDSCISKEVRISKYAKTSNNETYMQECELRVYNNGMDSPSNIVLYDDKGNLVPKTDAKSTTSNSDDFPLWKGIWEYDGDAGINTYTVFKNDEQSLYQWSMKVFYNPDFWNELIPARKEKTGFMVYPNPVKDNLYINNNNNGFIPIHYTIYNLTGKLQLRGIVSSEEEPVFVESLPSGSYIISLLAGDEKGSLVFIKN